MNEPTDNTNDRSAEDVFAKDPAPFDAAAHWPALRGRLAAEGLLRSAAGAERDTPAIAPSRTARAGRGRGRLPPPRGRARSWWITAVAAAILVMLGTLLTTQWEKLAPVAGAPAGVATLERVEGQALILGAGGERPARQGDRLPAGDKVLTRGPASRAGVRVGVRTRLELAGDTRLGVGPADRAAVAPGTEYAFLEQGALSADVLNRAGATSILRTPHAEIAVRGTRFTVAVQTEATRIEMQEGQVEVRNLSNNETVVLHEGYYALIGARTVVAAKPAFGKRPQLVLRRGRPGLQMLYTFEEGSGPLILDRAGTDEPLNLRIEDLGPVSWLAGGGLHIRRAAFIVSEEPAARFAKACAASNELTIEAWIKPTVVNQPALPPEPARIVTLSEDLQTRNFTFGAQFRDPAWPNYIVRLRHSRHERGYPAGVTGRNSISTELAHVVYTKNAAGQMEFYVNGRPNRGGVLHGTEGYPFTERWLPVPGDFANWESRFHLVLANEFTRDRPWFGELHRVALYSRALTAEEVQRNYRAGAHPREANETARR
ncbi:MAG: FecR domain-containing protein [Kiritimatiellae bacterium]|nr:FecR domain-containing protein [Kiritimatiellia bacterium]